MDSVTLTPGPDSVEKVIWSRSSKTPHSRTFETPCTGEKLTNRDGIRDDAPPFTCGTYPRRSVIKHFLRSNGMAENQGAKDAVVKAVKALINKTREAWSFASNFMCTCKNGTTGWDCCTEQSNCATEPCPCPDGYDVPASVACCSSVCGGLAGTGLMEPFSYIPGSQLATELLVSMGTYLQNDIWTSNDPWLAHDPLGANSYATSWSDSRFEVSDLGLFDASDPVVYYDEATYPFKATFWEHCAGLLQQVIWTMPMDRSTGKPKIPKTPYDPVSGVSQSPNITYTEEFIQSLVLEAYKTSPLYWHYNVRHTPSQSEVCQRTTPRMPMSQSTFEVGPKNNAKQLGFSSMTLGGLGGTDCYCGWWNSENDCRIPDTLCAALVQFIGFSRICVGQKQVYNASDHSNVLTAIQTLLKTQPTTTYPCPSLQISEHWGLMDSNGSPFANTTDQIISEGLSGFRLGNADWLFSVQTSIINPKSRIDAVETPSTKASQMCNTPDPSIADHFIDELFPAAQGVRQSMPQSYCTRYGIELARLTVYSAAGLTSAVGQQQGVVDKWKSRCQYKLQELAVCNSYNVLNATGAQTSAEQCPFTISVVESVKYSITPGCLIIVWNTATQDGIYDPCICISCSDTPNIDVPAQLTSVCRLESLQSLVAKDVIPSESSEVPIASGSFHMLMDKTGLQVNTDSISHWAVHTTIRDGDLTMDWWPDEWKHPVGYHVTPGCSRRNDAHWKTFDASWRWDGNSMVLARDETNDAMLSRNAFGGAGVCRTNNFGMPMTMLNTMTVCTKENANAQADPMVPAQPMQIPWADGQENCAANSMSTPWHKEDTDPPNQWTVGSLQNTILQPLSFSEWGNGCGPYALATCKSNDDCAKGLACVSSSSSTGVCAYIQPGKFECTAHIQCGNDLLCSGDGVCVNGVWQVKNEANQSIAFRTYSQNCATGDSLDTWGTSAAETIPDILNASGLCSYRSWFENKRMARLNQCSSKDTCSFSGFQAWNFSAPHVQMAGQSAFESDVLKVRPHGCDRNYQYFDGFTSCTPNASYFTVYDPFGNPVATNSTKDTRTRTYRRDYTLPLIHYLESGPTFGFTGIPLTYAELKLGTTSPLIVPCTAYKVCGFQQVFKVNGNIIDQRLVRDNGVQRSYRVQDLLSCGVFGFLFGGGSTCQLDYAIVPLAGYVLNNHPEWLKTSQYLAIQSLKSMYTSDRTKDLVNILSQIPDLILKNYIGKLQTFQDYVTKTEMFASIYAAIQVLDKPTYPQGKPNQLYYITQFGAYEVPFAWWFKCVWMAGFPMSATPIDSCSWDLPQSPDQPTAFGNYDNRIIGLFGLPPLPVNPQRQSTVLDQLVRLPGIITQDAVDQAIADYTTQRTKWLNDIQRILSRVQRMCFTQRDYISNFSDISEQYQVARLRQTTGDQAFDKTQSYVDSNNIQVCTGDSCLKSTGYTRNTISNAEFASKFISDMQAAMIELNEIQIRAETVEIADMVIINNLTKSAYSVSPSILATFGNTGSNCNIVTSMTPNVNPSCLCSAWKFCSTAVKNELIRNKKLPAPDQNKLPVVDTNIGSVNACEVAPSEKCFLNTSSLNFIPGKDMSQITRVSVPTGFTMETYVENRWKCVDLSCVDSTMNRVVPAGYSSWSSLDREMLMIDDFEYTQTYPFSKTNPWTSLQMQTDELNCANNRNRFYFEGLCRQTCTIEERKAGPPLPVVFKGRRISYFVNNTLKAELEYYPCTVNNFHTSYLQHMGHSDYKITLPQNTYKIDSNEFIQQKCDNMFTTSANLPVNNGILRKSMSKTYDGMTLEKAHEAVSRIINSINTNIVNGNCIQYIGKCEGSFGRSTGSVEIKEWSDDKKRTKYCNSLTTDPYFGCMMFPGENTMKKSDYSTQGCEFYELLPCGGGNAQTSNKCRTKVDYNEPVYQICTTNDPKDVCKSIEPVMRDMKLTGKSTIYQLTTVSPACEVGQPRMCTITDEVDSLNKNHADISAACPGLGTQAGGITPSRYKSYWQLVSYEKIYTTFQNARIITANESEMFIDHLFLSPNPDYVCSSLEPSTCPHQLTVEILKGLWKCVTCPLVTQEQCKGSHGCQLSSAKLDFSILSTMDGWSKLTSAQQAFLTTTDSDVSIALPAVQWLASQILYMSGLSQIRLSYTIPDFISSYKTSTAESYTYNPTQIIGYDITMQKQSQSCGSDEGNLPDFRNCSYDEHKNKLRSFSSTNYKVNDGVILHPNNTLQWNIFRAQFTSNNIPHWNAIANKSGMFVTDLLDDKWCLKGNLMDNACYMRNSGAKTVVDVLNPGMLGDFEPRVGCDTTIINQQRVISSVCGDCETQDEYLNAEQGTKIPCPQTFDSVLGITTDITAESNLCGKRPTDTGTCKNLQGALYGVFSGSTVSSVYNRQKWTGGLPAGIATILSKKITANVPPTLTLNPSDIGGHYVRMVLTTTRSGAFVLSVQGVPLLSSNTYDQGKSSSLWTPADIALETYKLRNTYPNSVCSTWDCPLRRRAFYMGLSTTWRPLVPDPLRTSILFGTRAHPTQEAFPIPFTIEKQSIPVLKKYTTSNGFSMTPTKDIGALIGQWTNSSFTDPCSEQLDWPYAGGGLRDKSSFSQRWNLTSSCGVIDRLPLFQYRYVNSKATIPSSKTTLDPGGVCHMGWAIVQPTVLKLCHVMPGNKAFMCDSFIQPKNLTRLQAKTIREFINAPTRTRLSDCNPPPQYVLNDGTATAPEVSYGLLKRWEASRLLANDLRRRLCGNSTVCKPAASWSLPTFWSNVYAKHFPTLPSGNGANDTLWSKPWVACIQHIENNTQTCDGTIPRNEWAVNTNRPKMCINALEKSPLGSKLVQNINVCDLDSSLDKFCRTIQDARYSVFEANCLYSGQCRQKLFFYQPSTFSVDNSQFVRSTVQTFYNSTVSGACIPDQDTAAAILANAPDLEKCAATSLNVMVDCIQIIRVIIGSLVELFYYSGTLWLSIFELIGATNAEKPQIVAQINALLTLMKNKFILLFQEIGDLVYEILFNGPMGAWLKNMITAICNFLEWLFSKVVYVVLCWVNTVSVWVLQNWARGFVDILNAIAVQRLGYLYENIDSAVDSIQSNIPCTPRNLWSCNMLFNDSAKVVTTLPMPTRCWAGVEPGVNSLACTAADTCMQSDYSKVICGACPAASSMIKFGCDTLTKLCTCSVFPVGITSCSSHEECTMDSSDVSCRYVDSYLQPSYGNIPCTQCRNPMCLITDGSGIGKCSCLLRPIPNQRCSNPGQRVSPNAAELCLVATANGGQSASNAYTQDYRTLSSAPCMLLNQAQTYCMKVYTTATVSLELVVGLALLHTRRRLLSIQMMSNTSVWDGEGEPCKSLVNADLADLGILEKYTRSECWRWYEIGTQLVSEANMTGVNPFLLVSWSDLVSTMLNKGAMVEIMAKLPSLMHKLLLHSEIVQPMYIALTYWTSLLPADIWNNQSSLNLAKAALSNFSAGGQMFRFESKTPHANEQYATKNQSYFNQSYANSSNQSLPNQSSFRRRLFTVSSINSKVSSQTVYDWSQGPYSWPPNYQFWDGDQSCAMASTAIEVLKNGLASTAAYYQNPRPPVQSVWWPTLPVKKDIAFNSISTSSIISDPVNTLSNITEEIFDEDAIKSFLKSAQYMKAIKGMIQCNFTRIQTCSDSRPLFWSAVQCVLLALIASVVVKSMDIPYVDTLILVFFTTLFLYITYGYAPTCAPLVPTCLLDDIVDLLEYFFPDSIQWPPDLVTEPDCSSVSCLRSCTDDPLIGFSAWQDHLGWIACEIDSQGAMNLAKILAPGDSLRTAIFRKCMADSTAQRICFAITVVRSIPLLLIVLVLLWLIPAVLAAGLLGMQFGVGVLFNFVIFVHSRAE